jgi:zinc protease
MKNKVLKFAGVAIFSTACWYIVQTWEVFHFSPEPDIGRVDKSFAIHSLDVTEIDTGFKHSLWSIKTENPTVAYNITFRHEGSKNFADYPGILDLIDNTLLDGAGPYSSSKLKEILIDNNIKLSVRFEQDDIILTVYTIADNFDLSIDIVSNILTNAHLKTENLEINKSKLIEYIKQQTFESGPLARAALDEMMLGKAHPYSIDTNFAEILRRMPQYTKNDVDKCYVKIFTAENARIVVASPNNQSALQIGFSKLLQALNSTKRNDFGEQRPREISENWGKIKKVDLETTQSCVMFALPGIPRSAPEWFAYRMAVTILGGSGFESRLFKDVREKHGLAYNVGAYDDDRDLFANCAGLAKTSPENVEKLIERIKAVIRWFAEQGITEEELDYHKMVRSSQSILENAQKIVAFVSACRTNGVKCRDINNYQNNYYNLSLDEVNKTIKKIFDYKKLLFISVGQRTVEGGEK